LAKASIKVIINSLKLCCNNLNEFRQKKLGKPIAPAIRISKPVVINALTGSEKKA
jgi:hypothetical protein